MNDHDSIPPASDLADGDLSTLLDDWLASPTVEPDAASTATETPPPSPAPHDEPPARELAGVRSLLDALLDERHFTPAAADPGEPGEIHKPEPIDAPALHLRLVLFASAGGVYAVRDALVTEVGRVPKITAVPRMPPWLRGVTSLRGDIVSVIDVRTFLGLEATSAFAGRLIVVRLLDEEFAAALLVDDVLQIASVPVDAVKAPTAPIDGALAPFLTGVVEIGGRLVAVLDLERLLRSEEIRRFEDVRDA